jgi:3-dehydroquinate dehydratase II
MANTGEPKKILVIHGPNLNMLGQREPETYGYTRLADIDRELKRLASQWGLAVDTFQSNHEGAIVDAIQRSMGKLAGLIINPAAFTHTSIAIRDALIPLAIPIIEVHISNVHKREPFRHHSYIADIATGQIVGLGVNGYYLALRAMADLVGACTPSNSG